MQAIGSHLALLLASRLELLSTCKNGPKIDPTSHSNEPIKKSSLLSSLLCAKCIFKGRKTKKKSLFYKVVWDWGTFLPILGLSLFTTWIEAAEEFGSGSSRYDFFTNGNLDLLEDRKKVISHSRRFIYEIVTLAYRISLIRSFFPPSDTGHSQSISTPSMSPLR